MAKFVFVLVSSFVHGSAICAEYLKTDRLISFRLLSARVTTHSIVSLFALKLNRLDAFRDLHVLNFSLIILYLLRLI